MTDTRWPQIIECDFREEAETLAWASQFAKVCTVPCVIFLEGDLGVGKTTWARGFLQGLGYQDKVKSPTYTLVEAYQLVNKILYHFDLYRLSDPAELEFVGVRDYFSEPAYSLVEWPERGQGILPEPDLRVILKRQGEGRKMQVMAVSDLGGECLLRHSRSLPRHPRENGNPGS